MKGQTVHLPKRAWRLGLFFIGILLAGGVLLMYKEMMPWPRVSPIRTGY